jgi:hypothetical protein
MSKAHKLPKKIEKKEKKMRKLVRSVKRSQPIEKHSQKETRHPHKVRDNILLGTHSARSNTHGPRDHSEQSRVTALSVADPFEAYARNLQPSVPFATNALPTFGFWTRVLYTISDIPFAGSVNAGSAGVIAPWIDGQYTPHYSFLADGTPSFGTPIPDPARSVCLTSFDTMTVCAQGVRVRNTTNQLNVSGECVLGVVDWGERSGSYGLARSSLTSFSTSASHESMLEMNYIGTPGGGPSTGQICSYTMNQSSTTYGSFDGALPIIYFRSFTTPAFPQTWEFEIVTYYATTPFQGPQNMFGVTSKPTDVNMVADTLGDMYGKAPRFSELAVSHGDRGIDDFWSAIKSTVRGAGQAGISLLAGVATSSWNGLFSKDEVGAFYRVLSLVPPSSQLRFHKLLNEHVDCASTLAYLEKVRDSTQKKRRLQALLGNITLDDIKEATDYDDTISQADETYAMPYNTPVLRRSSAIASSGNTPSQPPCAHQRI